MATAVVNAAPSTGREAGEPEVINGFRVIAEKTEGRYRVILGHRPDHIHAGRHEYVVGHNVHPDGKSWGSGTYCWDLTDALDTFTEA